MKPFSMNLSKMKKISGDKESSTFMHPSGHKMVIAHSAVSPSQRLQLEKMPAVGPSELSDSAAVKGAQELYGSGDPSAIGYSKGGRVKMSDGGTSKMPSPEELQQSVNAASQKQVESQQSAQQQAADSSPYGTQDTIYGTGGAQMGKDVNQPPSNQDSSQAFVPGGVPSGPAENPEANREPSNAPFKPQVPDPFGMVANTQAQIAGMTQEQRGQQALEAAKGAQGKAQAPAEEEYQKAVGNTLGKYQDNMQKLLDQDLATQKAIATGQINPLHYINQMSTGQKVLTGIGLALGGAGAHSTGGTNLAQQYLQTQINNDIDAQKANLNSQQTLLGHNLQLMGNLKDAQTLTQIQQGDLVNSHLRMEADKAATPQALASSQIIGGQWAQKKAELQKQLSINQALLSPGQDSEQQFQNRMQFLRMNGQGDMAKEMESKHIPGVPGSASIGVTPENREALVHLNNLKSLYGKAQDYLNNVGVFGAGWQNANKAKGQSIMEQMNLEMGQLQELKRYTPTEAEHYKSLIPDLTGTHFTHQDQAKLDQLTGETAAKRSDILGGVGAHGGSTAGYTPPQEIRRLDKKSGKVVIYDQNKKFLRYE